MTYTYDNVSGDPKAIPGKVPFIIPPGLADGPSNTLSAYNHTSLDLYGQGTLLYGEGVNKDLLHLLENFASPTPPPTPTVGQLWYNTLLDELYVYDMELNWKQSGYSSAEILAMLSTNLVKVVTPPVNDNSTYAATTAWVNTSISASVGLSLAAHEADFSLHLTPAQNVLLDGIAPTITSAEINALDGITGNVQQLINNVSSSSASTYVPIVNTSTTATPNKILYLDASGQLPATAANANKLANISPSSFVRNDNGLVTLPAGLNVTGNIAATGNITAGGNIIGYYSDGRLKTNIKTIDNALDRVSAMSGVFYTASELAATYGYTSTGTEVGVIAQQVQAVLPEVIKLAPFDTNTDGTSKSGENYLTVQYERIVPLLIEAIKELKAEIDLLKKV
jgi:hypothetical protein